MFESVVDVQEGQVISVNVGKLDLGLVSSSSSLARSDEAHGHSQHRRGGQDFVRAVELAGGDAHLCQLWIEGELRHHGAQLGQVTY